MAAPKRNALSFLILISIALLILFSWINPLTATYWQDLDIQAFYLFNSWIATNHLAQIFWSFTNYLPTDLLLMAMMLISIFSKSLFLERNTDRQKTILFFVLVAVMFMFRFAINALYGDSRESPSLILEPVNLLSQIVPTLHSKDIAYNSFPSDHAAILFTWMSFMLIYAKQRFKLFAVFMAIFFSLPRLVSGAHWLSDVLVGSLFVTLLSVAIVCYTPFGVACSYAILSFCRGVKMKLVKQ